MLDNKWGTKIINPPLNNSQTFNNNPPLNNSPKKNFLSNF